ncbi:MAG: 4Fe-4S binding protein [Deltaproteobacteria bacterium]|nr:4Fe-4S binding protein [Deltaproteobacteria bacterium]
MEKFRYLPNVSTLKLDESLCIGCGSCTLVCPHSVFTMNEKKAHIADFDGCMECGACMNNCPVAAIDLRPGVGCAAAIIQSWFKGKVGVSCETETCC